MITVVEKCAQVPSVGDSMHTHKNGLLKSTYSIEVYKHADDNNIVCVCVCVCVCKACEVNVKQYTFWKRLVDSRTNLNGRKLMWNAAVLHVKTNPVSILNQSFSLQQILDSVGTTSHRVSSVTNWFTYQHKNASRVQEITCCVCCTKQKHEHQQNHLHVH